MGKDVFRLATSVGQRKKVSMRNRTSELRISCFDALPLSHARDMTKNIFLCFFTELKTYHLSYCIHKHDAIDIADPSCMQGASHMNFVVHFAHRRVSAVPQWLSIGARNSWVWGLIPHGNSEFFLCLMLVTRRKTSFSISYPSHLIYHLCYSINSSNNF